MRLSSLFFFICAANWHFAFTYNPLIIHSFALAFSSLSLSQMHAESNVSQFSFIIAPFNSFQMKLIPKRTLPSFYTIKQ